MLREQLVENVREVHLRWELKRLIERDPVSTFLAIPKVALMSGSCDPAGRSGRVWPIGKWRPLMHLPKCWTSWLPI